MAQHSFFQSILSGLSFYLRWPPLATATFHPVGIVWGALIQAGLWVFFYAGAGFLSHNNLHFNACFASIGLAFITGFFHEDGLADTADSFGVPLFPQSLEQQRNKALSAMKDSRLGTYGVCSLVLLWMSRYHMWFNNALTLKQGFMVILFSRSTMLLFALCTKKSFFFQEGKASHSLADVPTRWALLPLICIASCIVTNLSFMGVFVVVTLSGVYLLKRMKALHGDFLGALVCVGEVLSFMIF